MSLISKNLLPPFQIVSRFGFSRCIAFCYIPRHSIHLEKPKRLIIWYRGSIILFIYWQVNSELQKLFSLYFYVLSSLFASRRVLLEQLWRKLSCVVCMPEMKKKRDISGDIIKDVRDFANTILKTITGWMTASTFFRGITQLLDHSDSHVKRKVLVG